MDYAVPILLVGLTWLVLLVVLVGIGLLGFRAVGGRDITGGVVVSSAWLGYAGVIVILQIWHLWWPAGGGGALGLVVAFGLTGIILHARGLVSWAVRSVTRHYIAWPLTLLLLAWVAHRAAGPCTCPDSGLYHVNAVRWAAKYPIIRGIANLHDRLAFNNTNFLFAAMLEFGPWVNRTYNLANGLLVAMLWITSITAVATGWQKRARLQPHHIFGAMLLTTAVMFSVHAHAFNISSHSSNLASAVTVLAAFALMLTELHRPPSTWGAPDSRFAVLAATALLTTSVTIKLSTAATCGLAWVILVTIWWRRTRSKGTATLKPLVLFVVVSAALAGPWMWRSVLLSGYPIFPKTTGGLNVDWTFPAERAHYLEELITTWAQNKAHPGEIKGWEWLTPWYKKLMVQYDRYEALVIPLFICAGGLVVMLLRAPRVWRYRLSAARTLWLLPPIVAGLVFWFIAAPDPRFAAYLSYALAAMIVAIALGTAARSRRSLAKRISLLLCLAVALTPIAYRTIPARRRMGRTLAQTLDRVMLHKPGPDHGFFELPKPRLIRRKTDSGLVVYIIRPGGATWDGPLMTTTRTRFDRRLRLRTRGDVRGGFTLAPPPTSPPSASPTSASQPDPRDQ